MWEGIWEKGDLLGAGRETSSHAGGGAPPPSLHPSHPPAGRPLLLRSRPVSAAVARALLLLSTQGEERAGVGAAGRRGHMPGYGRSALLLCPKAVLACINISSMRQMFFQMQELPQLWRISRVDFVRNGIPPRLPPPISQHPQPLPWIKANCHGPKFCNPPPICIPPNPFTQRQEGWGLHPFRLEYLSLFSRCNVCISPVGQSCPFLLSLCLPSPGPHCSITCPAVTAPGPLALALMAWPFFWAFHSHPCPAGCVDGHMGGCSDPECGPGPGRRCGLLHDDRGLPHPEVGEEMREVEMRGGETMECLG